MRTLLDLVLPARCAACGAPGGVACRPCAAPLEARPWRAWPRPCPRGLPPPYAVAPYGGAVRAFLLAYKEEGVIGLRPLLADAIALAATAALVDVGVAAAWLVPVPSSAAARRTRGDDVVLRLTRRAARQLRSVGHDVRVLPALRHVRAVRDSAGLSASERTGNLVDAFGVRVAMRPDLPARPVLVVDDLVTTGATVAECARTLRGAGAEVVAAATVAATTRRGDSPGGPAQARSGGLPCR